MIAEEQIARAREISATHLEALEKAVAKQDAELARVARQAIDQIKAAEYDPRQVQGIVRRLFAERQDVLSHQVSTVIQDAAELPGRIAKIARERGLIEKETPDLVTRAEQYEAARAGPQVVAASLKAGVTPELSTSQLRPKTAAERVLGRVIRPGQEVTFSQVLHQDTAALQIGSEKAIGRAIREMRNADIAGKQLITATRAAGGEVAAGQGVPVLLDNYVAALKRINAAAGLSPEQLTLANADVVATRKALDRYVKRLAEKRGGYLEFRQIIDKAGPQAVDRALGRWLDEKQRYNAERIMRTEAAAARRIAEHERRANNPSLIGYVARMSTGHRKGYVARTKPYMKPPKGIKGVKGKKGGKGRCLCEFMAGRVFSVNAPLKWPRMFHPHCLCFWDPIYRGDEPSDISQSALSQLD